MYARFFGLKREPFSISPDPRFLFMSERHREALAHLLYGVDGGGGFVLLTGEVGAGKTTVCRCFLEQIPKRCNVAYIFNPKLTVTELLNSVCDEFGVPYPHQGAGSTTVKDYVDPLNEFLLKTHAVGQNNVLIIDEAQNLSAEVLEQLRLLTNLETNERKLLQIILIGQPELRDMLALPELEQLAQRVVARFHLQALSAAETSQYIRHRLAVAGLKGPRPFEREAVQRIHALARGVPRRINLLCDRALLGAYSTGKARVDRKVVDKAAVEVFGAPSRGKGWLAEPRRLALAASAGLAAVLVAGAVGLGWRGGDRPSAAAASASAPGGGGAASGAQAGGASARAAPSASAATVASTASAASGTATASAAPGTAASAAAPAAVAATATMAASAPAPAVGTATSASTAATDAALSALIRNDKDAWRELAPLWRLPASEADPCLAAQRSDVLCFKGGTSLALIRQLGRPGILTLRGTDDKPGYALLTGLTGQSAVLRMQGATHTVSLESLARTWRGEFATFWRAPAGYRDKLVEGSTGPAVDWLAARLAKLQNEPPPPAPQTFNAALKAKVYAFQFAQELKPDGVAGPETFMLLNRATGVDEPRLQTEE
ncbi:MAG: peptidoglycan-binding protein [Methylibium sp. NZG]|nr:MAG: peptidoglycan-binding protein [Methylibium sp. NZG]